MKRIPVSYTFFVVCIPTRESARSAIDSGYKAKSHYVGEITTTKGTQGAFASVFAHNEVEAGRALKRGMRDGSYPKGSVLVSV
jgi:hypothetical protein